MWSTPIRPARPPRDPTSVPWALVRTVEHDPSVSPGRAAGPRTPGRLSPATDITTVLVAVVMLGSNAMGVTFGQCVAAEAADSQTAAIRRILNEQTTAWNAGSIEQFMDHYWNSDTLTFSSGGQTTRGWLETRDRYLRRYPDRAAMGKLSFDSLQVFPLGRDACFVLGRWTLHREADNPCGNFTLVLRRIDGRWLIVHDHTSVLEEPH